jgi:DNA modification methylase
MQKDHKIIIADSQQMPELADSTIHLMVTSPPYPMIEMWDTHLSNINSQIDALKQELEAKGKDGTLAQIYEAMHETLARTWRETYRVPEDGGIACINIGDATRTGNGKFRLFLNHSRVIEHCEHIGFTALP